MSVSAARTDLTELECCALGVIWRQGRCSAYAVRREFANSPSSHWSASAGAIYPAIRRLQQLGLVASASRPSDGRGSRELAATAEGIKALRTWIADLDDWTARPTRDPIRARMNFLDALATPKARLDFIARAEQDALEQIGVFKTRAASARGVSDVEYFVTLGSLNELYGRVRWLRQVRRVLKRPA